MFRDAVRPDAALRLIAVAGLVAAAMTLTACAPPPGASDAASTTGAAPRAESATPPLDKSTMKLVMDERFDGDALDESRWLPQLAWGKVNGEEQQYYDPGALKVADGMLTIMAHRHPAGGKPWTSGAIVSFERFEFTYGYVEMRARVPKGQGLWPSFWMLSTRPKDPTEIDIAEFKGQNPYAVQTSLHWGMGANFKHTSVYTGPDYSAGFHTYGMDWQRDSITWYVDGVERFRVTDHIPDMPMYLIANLSVGGRYPGPPDATTPGEAEYRIDYIRVYEHGK